MKAPGRPISWCWCGAWVIAGMGWYRFVASQSTVTVLTASELYNLLQKGFFEALVDVRTAAEFETGHIAGAMWVDSLALAGTSAEVTNASALVGCEHCHVAVYCRSGSRAAAAASYLASAGFTSVYNGLGINQWTDAGYPLVTTPSVPASCTINASVTATCWVASQATPSVSPFLSPTAIPESPSLAPHLIEPISNPAGPSSTSLPTVATAFPIAAPTSKTPTPTVGSPATLPVASVPIQTSPPSATTNVTAAPAAPVATPVASTTQPLPTRAPFPAPQSINNVTCLPGDCRTLTYPNGTQYQFCPQGLQCTMETEIPSTEQALVVSYGCKYMNAEAALAGEIAYDLSREPCSCAAVYASQPCSCRACFGATHQNVLANQIPFIIACDQYVSLGSCDGVNTLFSGVPPRSAPHGSGTVVVTPGIQGNDASAAAPGRTRESWTARGFLTLTTAILMLVAS